VPDKKEPDMQTNQTPEALAEELRQLSSEVRAIAKALLYTPGDHCDSLYEISDRLYRMRDMAASGAKDAERYAKARYSLRWSINPARVATCSEVDAHVDDMPAPTDLDLDAAIAATKRGGV
jgi:hypothetical protein